MDSHREPAEILVFDNVADIERVLHAFKDPLLVVEKEIAGKTGIWFVVGLDDLRTKGLNQNKRVGVVCQTAKEKGFCQSHFPEGQVFSVFRFAPGLWNETGNESLPEDYSFFSGILES
ncbi:MAG TPA: hypothetical protein VND43_08300 [Burkholderiales bacterium]|nr:hypothetical protein [Pseudomonadota bacterium]HVC50143.1 hypothetical protein [Burkholderiales bacterium]